MCYNLFILALIITLVRNLLALVLLFFCLVLVSPNDQMFHSFSNSILVLIHFSLLSPSMPLNGQRGNILAPLGGRLCITIFCICIWYLIHLLCLIISSFVCVFVYDNVLIFCKILPSHGSTAGLH